jgi:hypothetical protein
MALSGDELVPEPADSSTLAIDVDAPVETVWPWLVQLGQDRGGMYSYDWLENLLGLRIHSADHVEERWQRLAAGDRVRLVREGWLGLREGLALSVALVDPPRSLVLREAPPETPWDAAWSFHVLPRGSVHSRLVSRGRSSAPHGLGRIATAAMEPVTLVMTRKMLLGIKERAEHLHRAQARRAA